VVLCGRREKYQEHKNFGLLSPNKNDQSLFPFHKRSVPLFKPSGPTGLKRSVEVGGKASKFETVDISAATPVGICWTCCKRDATVSSD